MSGKKMVGKKIIELRKERGYKRDAFAEMLGMPPTTLRNYELGIHEPGHSFVIQIARFFSVTTDYLLGLSPVRMPEYPTGPDDGAISVSEMGMLRSYRRLDEHGKRIVALILEEESRRCQEECMQPDGIQGTAGFRKDE